MNKLKSLYKKISKHVLYTIFQENSLEVYQKFIKTLGEIGVEPWICFGTLLGAIRENDFIKYDNDMDFGLFKKDWSLEIEEHLIKAGFIKVLEINFNDGEGFEQSWYYKKIKCDLFYFEEKNNYLKCHTFFSMIKKPTDYYLSKNLGMDTIELKYSNTGFDYINFKGIRVKIPKKPEVFLMENYGEGYDVYDPNWDYTKDPKSIVAIHPQKGKIIEYKDTNYSRAKIIFLFLTKYWKNILKS